MNQNKYNTGVIILNHENNQLDKSFCNTLTQMTHSFKEVQVMSDSKWTIYLFFILGENVNLSAK